ncbi:S-layer homology domain-containing protein [Chamaesiphon sp. VAR_69_metabat_338]|uniref:S-layer homology domain-containing protein n=1 Tax=Chamaesiphon sp. VAR_69_metabat_338 TaxID=2964704 RepID=UPI00286DA61E|nr:S-layer homology domain-containing protein [Chamaesiphon sp. VAR_69_metabat_338]
MTNSPTPNPNRRRRLTADELIAIGVALAGIGTVFFWGIGQKYQPMFQAGISSLTNDNNTRRPLGTLGGQDKAATDRQTIASMTGDRQESTTTTTTTTTASAPPIVKTVEDPAPSVPAPIAAAPAIVAATPKFKDVPKQFWGETYITELQKRGILADFGTGKFDPDKEITRGEYAKMLDRAFADRSVTAATAPKFQDIPADYPRKEAIDKSVQLGFMTGYSPSKFAPNQPIPRYQLQISLAKGLQLAAPANPEPVLSKYADAKEMPKYAREKMAAAIASGIVIKDKTPNLLKPTQNATRADAAASIYEVLVKAGKIKPQSEN